MIVFPEPAPSVDTQAVASVGGAEKYGRIDASLINVENLDAGNITAGSISADRIAADSIDATKLNVSQLSAITADMGSITAGTITGGDIFSSSNATKIHLDNGDYIRFYASSAEKARIRGSTARSGGIIQEIGDYFLANDKSFCVAETSGSAFARWGVNSSNQLLMVMPSTNQFFLKNAAENSNLFTVSAANGGFFEQSSGGDGLKINGTLNMGPGGSSQSEGSIVNVDIVKGANDLRLQTNDYVRFLDSGGNVTCYIKISDGTFHTGSI